MDCSTNSPRPVQQMYSFSTFRWAGVDCCSIHQFFFLMSRTDQMFDLSFQLSKHLLKLENKVLFTVTRLCKLLYFVISSFRSLLVDYEMKHLKEEVLLKLQSFRIKIWTSLFRNIMYHFLWSYSKLVQCSSSINASSVIVCFTFTCEVTYVTKNSIHKYLVLA